MVVIVDPNLCLFPHLIDILEYIFVEHPTPIASVEPFHEGILGRFPGLDIFELDPVHLAPIIGYMGNEFRAIVHSYLLWFPLFIDKMVKYPDNAVTGQGKVNFYMKCFPVKIVDDVEGPETFFVLQNIGHEIHAPCMVELIGNF